MPKLTNVSLTGLDFDDLKASLTTYLQSQSEFEDYDFEGSSLSILLNILAYNTHYQAYYLNMVANEMFLESAQTRSSVVAAAKALGYTPQSARAASAELNLTLVRNSQATATVIDKYTPFNFTQGGTTYTFLTVDDTQIDTSTDTATVVVKEGAYSTFSYVFDDTNQDQRLLIPDEDVDTSTITISVFDSPDSTTSTEYTLASDVSSLTATSKVYFISENPNGKFEIYFGDDTIGQKPTNGNLIKIEYLVTSGVDANGAGSKETTSPLFTFSGSLTGYSSVTARVSDAASGGADKQSIDQIRFLAPLFYESQNRAVTVRDYEAIVKQQYPSTESLFIYGGEDATPVEYGKVFIAIKPIEGTTVSARVRNNIKELIKEKNLVTVTPEVVDADTVFCTVDTKVFYDPRLTSKSSGTILSEVVSAITDFGDNTLEKFNRSLRHSKFVAMIDEVDASISNNVTEVGAYKKVYPQLNINASYNIKFNNALLHPNDGYSEVVVSSDGFTHFDSISQSVVTAFLDDDGSGNIRMYRLINGEKSYININTGTVDYTTGQIILNNFKPTSISSGEDYIKVTVDIDSDDVKSSQNTILQILPQDISVEVVSENNSANTQIAGY